MQVHTDISSIRSIKRPILTIGTFDGVHLGHRVIINRLNELAEQEGGQSVLLTFYPHPRTVVSEAGAIDLLTGMEERLQRLEEAGLQHVIVHPFTKEFSRITALEYVRDLLVSRIGVYYAVVGYDHHFGRNREGGIEVLRELSEVFDFKVEEISAQAIDEVKVSSTKVRAALSEGAIETVTTYLGYPYRLDCTVVRGDGRGAGLGFPTANLLPDEADKLIPASGVYAVKVHLADGVYDGMLNIGKRPTFKDDENSDTLEVHILDFEGDLYGTQLKIEFVKLLRRERKFEDATALMAQLQLDKAAVRKGV